MNKFNFDTLTFNTALNLDGLNLDDIDKKIIQKTVKNAEKDLESGQFLQVIEDLKDIKFSTIFAVERLRYLANCRVVDEYELSRVPFWDQGFSDLIKLCDQKTAESYQAIKVHTAGITTECERLQKLVNAKMYDEALEYIKTINKTYPEYTIFAAWAIEIKLKSNDSLITVLDDLKKLSTFEDIVVFFNAQATLSRYGTFDRQSNWWIRDLLRSKSYIRLIYPRGSDIEAGIIHFGNKSFYSEGVDGIWSVLTTNEFGSASNPYFTQEEQEIIRSIKTEKGGWSESDYSYHKIYTIEVAITQQARKMIKEINEEKREKERQEKQRREQEERERKERRENNLCEFCGSEFKGIFKKVCKECGKPKSYK